MVVIEKVYVKSNSAGRVLYCSYFTISLLVVSDTADDAATHEVTTSSSFSICTQKSI